MENNILIINCGSSSIKFALYTAATPSTIILQGKITNIGLSDGALMFTDKNGITTTKSVSTTLPSEAVELLGNFLHEQIDFTRLAAIGHRFVYGIGEESHKIISPELLETLRSYTAIDPEHMPLELACVDYFRARYGALAQVACFDTVFHAQMPRVAKVLPIPRRFWEKGIRRYGFHGLSCEYLIGELSRIDGERGNGRVIILHLGSGASVTAVSGGRSIDTSMGYTPSGGIPMSARTGDIDPGVLIALMKEEKLSADELAHLINFESGLLGVSETSPEMHTLLANEESDIRAKDAIEMFCYEVKKRIGAYTAALGGVDTIIFSGGIGEGSPVIRARICAGLEFLGITLDEARNFAGEAVISSGAVTVRVMRTNEEYTMTSITRALIHK